VRRGLDLVGVHRVYSVYFVHSVHLRATPRVVRRSHRFFLAVFYGAVLFVRKASTSALVGFASAAP
jgi:hypothetical protein